MDDYEFVGWPLDEALTEASRRGIHIDARETSAPKKNVGKGIPYVVQERWIDAHTLVLIYGLRLIGEQE